MTERGKQIQDEITKRVQFAYRKIDNIISEYLTAKNLTEYDFRQESSCYEYQIGIGQGSRLEVFYKDEMICCLLKKWHTDDSKHTSLVIELYRGIW